MSIRLAVSDSLIQEFLNSNLCDCKNLCLEFFDCVKPFEEMFAEKKIEIVLRLTH